MAVLWLLHLLVLSPLSLCTNPGITVRLTQKGLEYGRQIGIAVLQQKLKSVHIPDISGKESVSPVGSVEYSLSGMQVVSLGLPQSSLVLAPGSGLSLSIGNAYISIDGNWRVKYLKFIKDHGSFDLSVSELTISAVMAVGSDETGRPTVSCTSCSASVGSAKIKFHGGASWLYNLFSSFIDKALRNALQDKLCPLVTDAIAGINPHLKTLNVLAKVDQYAEIEYSMVSSPVITKDYIDLNLKGEFYNIGKHQEPPFPAPGFSLPAQANSMLYFGVSQFTPNSAGFVYSTTGVLSINVTDDMIPKSSPLRLNTKTFGAFIPEIAKRYSGLQIELLVKSTKQPFVTFQTNNMTLQAVGSITAYAIQPNSTLTPLFILSVDASVSGNVYVSGVKVAGSLSLNSFKLSLVTSYVGPFQVQSLSNIFQLVLKVAVLPKVNELLQQGFPLPTIEKMNLVNTQLQIQKDYLLIGTDVQFSP
ncbi:bactericidal permeability-increasing protein [Lepisosteus oculatus]|uniref:bactericidal permeability-increasing protein n=1 Tax=Lepisosteus oculatus TaxID=7918 RepID=UPI0035F50B65